MTSKALRSKELFKVVREPNRVELDNSVVQVNSSWVHVSVNYSLAVQIIER